MKTILVWVFGIGAAILLMFVLTGTVKIKKNEIITPVGKSEYLPEGWREINPMAEGVVVSAEKDKANFNVTKDKIENGDIGEYGQYLKEVIKKVASEIKFTQESIEGFEAELSQQGVDYKSRLVLKQGQDNEVWILTFNAPKSDWEKYLADFESILKNFSIK